MRRFSKFTFRLLPCSSKIMKHSFFKEVATLILMAVKLKTDPLIWYLISNMLYYVYHNLVPVYLCS